MSQSNDDDVASGSISAVKKLNYAGPNPNVNYPLNVVYCGECGLPVDLCEYSANPVACKDWLDKNHPGFYAKLSSLQINENSKAATASGTDNKNSEVIFNSDSTGADSADADKKSHQRRGGKGMPKPKKERVPSKIIITKNQRKGNKCVTIISGLGANDIDIEAAKKFFAQRFASSCSKGDPDELIIQGDVVDSLFDVIPEKFSQITEDMIEVKEK